MYTLQQRLVEFKNNEKETFLTDKASPRQKDFSAQLPEFQTSDTDISLGKTNIFFRLYRIKNLVRKKWELC